MDVNQGLCAQRAGSADDDSHCQRGTLSRSARQDAFIGRREFHPRIFPEKTSRRHDGALSADTRLGAYLKMLKYSRRQDLEEHLRVILVPELADMELLHILRYIDRGPILVSRESMLAALRPLKRRGEEIMGHFSQEFEAKGRAIGRTQGRTEGRIEGKADALLRVLEKRFGAVPPRLRDRIATADVTSLDVWFDRALDVSDLNSVFESSEVA
jgi:hypothetical protein